MWEYDLDVKALKQNKDIEKELLELIKKEYLYSNINQKDFLKKYHIKQGAFWFVCKKYNLKKDFKYIKESMQKTTLEKYGVDNVFKDTKYIQTCFSKKYGEGIVNPGQVKEILNKREETCLNKYGVKSSFQAEEVKKKIKETNLKRYGVENPKLSDKLKDKERQTRLKTGSQKFQGNEVEEFLNSWHLSRKPTASDLVIWLEAKNKHVDLTNVYKLIVLQEKEEYFIKKESYLELIVSDFLDKYNIKYERHNRAIISPLELDFYIPEYNLALEVNDIYSHNSSQTHYGREARPIDYHFNKTNLCEERGIRLIHLFEPHLLNEHKWKVLQDIILHACKKTIKIAARKTKLKIDKAIHYKDFFNQNNINGYRKADTAFMLLDKNTNEPLMGYCVGDAYFGKGKYDAEIARGACKLGYTVVGGSSKLWNAIISYYNTHNLKNESGQLNSIVYYVDRNYYNGESISFLSNVEHLKNQYGFWNYDIETKKLLNRDPVNHKKIKLLEQQGKILVVGNAGTQVNVWHRHQ